MTQIPVGEKFYGQRGLGINLTLGGGSDKFVKQYRNKSFNRYTPKARHLIRKRLGYVDLDSKREGHSWQGLHSGPDKTDGLRKQ